MENNPPQLLYIDDATEVFLPLVRRGLDIDSATVSFGVYTARTGGSQIGGTVSMPWEVAIAQYAGIFPVASAAGLTESGIGGPFYWLRITAVGYTTRYVKCRAVYRGQS